jgi:hypothetical protein
MIGPKGPSPLHDATTTPLVSRHHSHGHCCRRRSHHWLRRDPRAPYTLHPSLLRANAAGVTNLGKLGPPSPVPTSRRPPPSVTITLSPPSLSPPCGPGGNALPSSLRPPPFPSLSLFTDTWAQGHNTDAAITADVGRVAHLSFAQIHHTHTAWGIL